MKTLSIVSIAALMMSVGTSAFALKETTVISDLKLLRELQIPVVAAKENMNVGVALVTPQQRADISAKAHKLGRCAGYKALPKSAFGPRNYEQLLAPIEKRFLKNQKMSRAFTEALVLSERPEIKTTIARVEESRLKAWVEWFSSFHDRFHANSTANDHVNQLKAKIEQFMQSSKLKYTVDLINHSSTRQKSLRVHLEGSQRPNEVVVIGGHYDSINTETIFGSPNPKGHAPGADDNASGSAAVLEALRLIAENGVQPERSIEFMWYAAEEVGLYGSQEIAADYRRRNVDVIAVMQLDMTMFPGSGELTIASMSDFTSPWLRNVFVELNRLYIGAKIVSSACGYGCSDHASWHDEGYATLMPAEAEMDSMNHNLHTTQDVIDARSNFKHQAAFAKAAVAFGLELGNSTLREK
jgi:bacterial leucyl aminopeptidase